MALILFFTLLFSSTIYAQVLEVVTTDFPPYQFIEKNEISGKSSVIVKKMISKANLKANFSIYPWPRAYQLALNNKNTLIYSIARTPERENKFQWIGKITPFHVYFWKNKKRADINLLNFEESKKYKIGGVFSDVKAEHLIKNGFILNKNIELVSSDVLNINKLVANHIDLMPFDELSFKYKVEKEGYTIDQFEKTIEIPGLYQELFVAASLNTSPKIIKKLKESLKTIKN